jgi:hypothetical protein
MCAAECSAIQWAIRQLPNCRMSGEDIDQFIRIEQGNGRVVMGRSRDAMTFEDRPYIRILAEPKPLPARLRRRR